MPLTPLQKAQLQAKAIIIKFNSRPRGAGAMRAKIAKADYKRFSALLQTNTHINQTQKTTILQELKQKLTL